jgi:hypothetical protein
MMGMMGAMMVFMLIGTLIFLVVLVGPIWLLCQGQLTFDPFRQLQMDPPTW